MFTSKLQKASANSSTGYGLGAMPCSARSETCQDQASCSHRRISTSGKQSTPPRKPQHLFRPSLASASRRYSASNRYPPGSASRGYQPVNEANFKLGLDRSAETDIAKSNLHKPWHKSDGAPIKIAKRKDPTLRPNVGIHRSLPFFEGTRLPVEELLPYFDRSDKGAGIRCNDLLCAGILEATRTGEQDQSRLLLSRYQCQAPAFGGASRKSGIRCNVCSPVPLFSPAEQ